MAELYIVGNGFDIYHGLKTSYADFYDFVNENYNDLKSDLDSYFSFSDDKNNLWKDFENDLKTFGYEGFFNDYNHIDILSDTFKQSECYGVEDEITPRAEELVQMIRDAFRDWIENIDYPPLSEIKPKKVRFVKESLFINFNYTNTLEELYGISLDNILYMHNRASDLQDLIFGHGETQEVKPKGDELDENGDSTRTMLTEAEDAARSPFYALYKNTDEVLESHQPFFNRLRNIKKITVLGHSLGKVDKLYFEHITKLFPSASWKISYHCEKEIMKSSAIEMLNLEKSKIEMIKIGDLRVAE
ncbi:bacteriophage abortive infection AbiH family protein [Mucilaginibacter sp.]|uniref:bacteriophage abortive infection AbiH family protein n=1 Tax=Mucilaginibacter sp. TaxID=1882438 RepID=UPI002844C318|nr:bacteriophage abortive infection AbiH family protein [Mucilaginibacter sp.]MDR3697744.1 bacteriophage abortive infection AbiH family protein [Mucilaginibacter sp.]